MRKRISFTIVDHSSTLCADEVAKACKERQGMLERILAGEKRYDGVLGWYHPESFASDGRIDRILRLSRGLQEQVDTLVVIGVGGSNQGARGAIEALKPEGGVSLVWAGNTLSSFESARTLAALEEHTFAIDVVAKNFETLEPGLAFRLFRGELERRYGAGASRYIYVTGTPGSHLEELARAHGYAFLEFPSPVGGRYSMFSDVGLLPMAAGGIDVRTMVEGAREMAGFLQHDHSPDNLALRYAVARNLLSQRGFELEMLTFFEPRFDYFARWWRQLLAESEGKEGKGLFPVASSNSEDLHSIGQYVQEGKKILFETFLRLGECGGPELRLAPDEVDDRFGYLDGKRVSEVNKASEAATLKAHSAKFPCLVFDVPVLDAYQYGALSYFFLFATYLSGSILGINPFDQEGVEAYKRWMFRALGKC